ncbi:MAG: DUF192 domain-containing protein [Actinomycetota bacterium]
MSTSAARVGPDVTTPRDDRGNPRRWSSLRSSAVKVVEMDGPGGRWRVLEPETRRERMRGLRGRPPPGPQEAMLFRRCRSVQTFGMRHEISVVFLDRTLQVIEVRRCRPGRVVRSRGARHALECSVTSGLRVGDRFELRARGGRRARRPRGPRSPRGGA